ncbi:hypothetical protein [Pseudomonas rhodesiae]|uniref:hypothetical protein n=1 Tax=Pseudomonas rhodesiae TaxID=76760 RepID=UPI00241D80FE|nr:hypothetical protein [Pseudomonas rhodesiae]
MSDYSELERLAEAANAVTGDVSVDIAISSERGPDQAEIDAVTAFFGATTPTTILALIAENKRLNADCSSMRGSLKAYATSIKKLIKDGSRVARERDQLKAELEKAQMIGRLAYNFDGYKAVLDERDQLRAEVAGLRTGYEAYERVNAELKAENDLLRKLTIDTGQELRKASSWICREVEAGTKSATHWAVRLHEKADQIDAAMGKGGRP